MENQKPMVLVVEGQKINREILKGILRRDYTVLEASNGKEAIDVLIQNPQISAILLDLVMPVMDGYQFLSSMKDTIYANIPVIAVTGDSNEGTEQKALDLGAADYVSKPYQPMTLLTRLTNAISNGRLSFLGNTLLNSLEGAAVVFLVNGSAVRNLGFNHRFSEEFVPLFGIQLHSLVLEQACLSKEDRQKIVEAATTVGPEKDHSEITLSLIDVYQKTETFKVQVRYWGKTNQGKIIFFSCQKI